MTDRTTMRPTRRQAAVALTMLAAVSLTACGGGEAQFEEGTQDAPSEAAPEEAGASDGGGQEGSSEASGQDADAEQDSAGEVIDPDDAVSTITYTLPTDEIEGTMTVGFHHLRLRGNTMELLLTYTPEFTTRETHTLWELHGRNHSNVAPALFDREHLKRYDILRTSGTWDGKTVWNSKQAEHELASGDTQAYWANFAAPEDDIEALNIAIPGAPEFEDVPIERDASASSGQSGSDADGQE